VNALRRHYHKAGFEVRAIRTHRLRRILSGTPFELLVDACVGPLLLVVVDRDPAAAADLTQTMLRWHEHLRLRGCALPGERIELDAMTKAPSMFAQRRALVRVLKKIPRILITTLAERGDVRVAIVELEWLRRRLSALLRGPRSRDDYYGTWTECRLDTDAIFASFASVRMRPGWRLCAYAFRQGGNGNGVVYAIPPGGADPEPFGTRTGSLFDPPRPLDARSVAEAIEADEDSPWSYVCVSILLREFAEFGALWHGTSWGSHHLVETLPTDHEWTVLEPLPRRLFPQIARRGDEVAVVFHTLTREGTVRLIQHIDTYRSGSWKPTRESTVLATGGHGYVY
jgi:hypothetical protein